MKQQPKQRCTCGSNYKPGERVSIFDFCLLCWGTGWRLPIRGSK